MINTGSPRSVRNRLGGYRANHVTVYTCGVTPSACPPMATSLRSRTTPTVDPSWVTLLLFRTNKVQATYTQSQIRVHPVLPTEAPIKSSISQLKCKTHLTMEGSCLCGAITVKVSDPDLHTQPRGHLCHCANCRKTSGSAYGANLMIESEKVEITGADQMKEYRDSRTRSGNTISRFFCGNCGK